MTSQRQNSDNRAKQLRLAILRIERGRAKTGAQKLSISAVAREAGITPALIHNHYPTIAEEIRTRLGASSRAQRDAKQKELQKARDANKALLSELAETRQRIARLASINETLLLENQALKATVDSDKVAALRHENR
ncbi:TetR family transcriptional regulator [Burkholderia vietnamiensis]|uniref:TetR family transcriptional regulator n=1 Tax=Burkholderia vietnamiensis TaxID=60552 RepID=UPI001CF3E2C9|nr:TetR family transcriptional regulator [Burkholderia vietnamiensis]MCA8395323.1 TetR family transcriptional regulator [Burkholderia vietnamiensis]HDR8962269.1 TetR family transcriptional regulator [Burkholderia vietnamiensis]HDR9248295.1 TetR family transcriptional regulator [Burkholderia vietnamiensis]